MTASEGSRANWHPDFRCADCGNLCRTEQILTEHNAQHVPPADLMEPLVTAGSLLAGLGFHSEADALHAVKAAVGDTVPREQHERHLAANRWPMAQLREARRERDGLAVVLENLRSQLERTSYWHQKDALFRILDAAPAVSLAQHNAEVWNAGVRAMNASSSIFERDVLARNPYRAAAIEEQDRS